MNPPVDGQITRVHGRLADPAAPAALLVEVPHGADSQAHYDALRARLRGPFPDRLERFFHVNTDVGAWQLGLRVAERVVEAAPRVSVLAVRCSVPRTFIDTNRVLGEGVARGMTPGMPPYVRDPDDQALLNALHAAYTERASATYREVCAAGGLALIPHTYAPRSVPIEVIDDRIVDALEAVYAPGQIERCPLRPEVDLITRTPDGEEQAPEGLPEALITGLAAIGVHAQRGVSYTLHPSTQGAVWSRTWPGQVLCFEVRRDLVTEWVPFEEKQLRPDRIDAIAAVLADAIVPRLPR